MTKIVCISDTHGEHSKVHVPFGDVLIHAGDFSEDIGQASLRSFLTWFESQPHANKLFVAGNHDGAYEKWPEPARMLTKMIAPSCTYLEDSGVRIEGVDFWGSPVTPTFFDWHFNRDRGEKIKAHWDMIPDGTDVLITHGTAAYPNTKLDVSSFDGSHTGCEELLKAVTRIAPKLHVFGHIHSGYGTEKFDAGDDWKVQIINASICNEKYAPVNAPWVYTI